MMEQYPFFRDADEQTQAVIGEEAVASDLNGTYQKPYAVLTAKRLYCKNEYGNFIVENSKLLGAGRPQNTSFFTRLLWCAFGIDAFSLLWSIWSFVSWRSLVLRELMQYNDYEILTAMVSTVLTSRVRFWVITSICLIAFLILWKRRSKIAPILLCAYPGYQMIGSIGSLPNYFLNVSGIISLFCMVAPVILVIIYYITSKNEVSNFEILHTGGNFTFPTKDYSAEELKNFEAQVKALKAGVASGK